MLCENAVTEFNYFKAHFDELINKYEGKYQIIKDTEVKADFGSSTEAYTWAIQNYKAGTFMLQLCAKGEDSRKIRFHSYTRVK